MMATFSELKLNTWITRQCQSVGIQQPTLIQNQCIPRILEGHDCIGCAKTGSGKTLAFALPILQRLCEDPYGIFALVLTPTRELAIQIGEQFQIMGRPINLRHSIIVGGMDMIQQARELAKSPHVVIATPGRLADHFGSCPTFTLKKIKFLVIDEADRILAGNFDEQLEVIFKQLPEKRQNLLFSATMTDALEKVKEVTTNQVFVFDRPEGEVATVETLQQSYLLCPDHVKDGYLVQLLRDFKEQNPTGAVIVFTNTCKSCQLLSMMLEKLGFPNMALHSMAPQKQRIAALTKFKSNHVRILIATDVASRGLDIPTVQLVVNHVIPNVPKDYVHRVGRTARAGRGGKAISLVTPRDINLLRAIEDTIHVKLVEHTVDDTEVATIFAQVSMTRREAEIKLDESDFFEKKDLNKKKEIVMQGKDPDLEAQRERKRRKKERKRRVAAAIKTRAARKEQSNSQTPRPDSPITSSQ
ncbi:hypothetical protein B566_EDAN014574 [Ephemera danica]|nr:hypothetical protein B566_EDAN014574 [Ephemera danica]